MTLRRYTGLSPMNVSKDAKYSVTADGQIRLVYRASAREKWLLSTDAHSPLVDMVNAVKMALNGVPGGAFYINEYRDVLVPDGAGGNCYWAGNYEGLLEFTFEDDIVISPKAPRGLRPGDVWPGPHVGIVYVLRAGGQDIKYELKDGRRREEMRLSEVAGAAPAQRLARRIGAIKGTDGGRFYINEVGELFAPVSTVDEPNFLYLGHLDDDGWFPAPDGFDRP